MSRFGLKTAFLAPIPSPAKLHFCVVMTEPQEKPPIVVIVNVSTVHNKSHEDHTVILQPGDHEFIKQKSYVAFDYAKRVRLDILESHANKGKITFKEDVPDELFNRILDGLLKSPKTPRHLKSICRKSL